MTKRLETNIDLVTDLMSFSPRGPLGQIFIMQAIQKYAEQCIATGPAVFDNDGMSGQAWVDVATDVLKRCDAFYGRQA